MMEFNIFEMIVCSYYNKAQSAIQQDFMFSNVKYWYYVINIITAYREVSATYNFRGVDPHMFWLGIELNKEA